MFIIRLKVFKWDFNINPLIFNRLKISRIICITTLHCQTKFINIPKYGCINIHASLLPRWRGASPIQSAILAGDEDTGVSLMSVEEGLDSGPIFCSESITIGESETYGELHDRLATLGAKLLKGNLCR